MKAGLVYYHENFTFKDGEKGNKLVVIIAGPKDDLLLGLKTTSRPGKRGRPQADGCHVAPIESVFTFNTNASKLGFHEQPTWVVLEEPYEFFARTFNAKVMIGEIKEVIRLPADALAAIVNCLKKTSELSNYHRTFLP